ncbi:MAG: energy-coupling factor ABC transporter ATP-binding protein [Thermoflexales bacterium]|nr:energy-coupling factor ABC transporter ATP-binding protein [Thermoflexales bacterium]
MADTDRICATNLSYTYARRSEPTLDKLSVALRAGELTLIVGRSGSGKTTLARCINGLIPYSYRGGRLEGRLSIFGEDASALSLAQRALRIGTVLQDPDKQIVATRVYDELAFGPENLGLPREAIRERVNEAAARLRIAHLLDRETHTLSGGELQRVAIAGVAAMRPRALLLDEPLASLDPPSAWNALQLFRQLANEGIGVVMIEHRLREALRAKPQHCIELDRGTVTFEGDVAAFASRYEPPQLPLLPCRTTPGEEVILEFQDVSFRYPNAPRQQLSNVNLTLRSGEVIALLGANGAGKSTLCRIAIGLLRPTQGKVCLTGVDLRALTVAQAARQVGYVFQNPAAMIFASTIGEELSFGPRNLGMSELEIRKAIDQALHTVGLSDLSLAQSPFGLSFGQQKRLAIASVLTMCPRVLILDEPTAGLDEESAHAMLGQLLTAERRPETVVMVTHDLRLARQLATRVVLLADGRVIADGTPEVILGDADLLARARLLAVEDGYPTL